MLSISEKSIGGFITGNDNFLKKIDLPKRIVCTSYDSVDILIRLGCSEKIIGCPSESKQAEVMNATDIGGFGEIDVNKILELQPDLIITYSDMQSKFAGEFIKNYMNVLALNQLDISSIYKSIYILGSIMGKLEKASLIVEEMQAEINRILEITCNIKNRSKVYFEEWNKPYVTASRWISEIIEIAGGQDVFSKNSVLKNYLDREVASSDIIDANPDIIMASWCGIPINCEEIKNRKNWKGINAVKSEKIYEIPSKFILQPGPKIIDGLKYMFEILNSNQV